MKKYFAFLNLFVLFSASALNAGGSFSVEHASPSDISAKRAKFIHKLTHSVLTEEQLYIKTRQLDILNELSPDDQSQKIYFETHKHIQEYKNLQACWSVLKHGDIIEPVREAVRPLKRSMESIKLQKQSEEVEPKAIRRDISHQLAQEAMNIHKTKRMTQTPVAMPPINDSSIPRSRPLPPPPAVLPVLPNAQNKVSAVAKSTRSSIVNSNTTSAQAMEKSGKKITMSPTIRADLNKILSQSPSLPPAKLSKVLDKIVIDASNNNYQNYLHMGLVPLFEAGHLGQGVTVAVIEGGFHFTVAPEYRNEYNEHIGSAYEDFYFNNKDRILPPLEFYDAYNAPLNNRFEVLMGRGKAFRYSHGDRVLSQIAESAPQAKVLPVSVHYGPDGSFIAALESLSERDDVHVINMSRWLETEPGDETRLNKRVFAALHKCAERGKIIVLAAGNASSYIPTQPIRDASQLEVVNFLAANLITDLFAGLDKDHVLRKHILISGALAKNGDTLAHYSNKAGYGPCIENYIATKGVHYGRIYKYESDGTSMSAPYASASAAVLLGCTKKATGAAVVRAILNSAETTSTQPSSHGKGILKVDRAFTLLTKGKEV